MGPISLSMSDWFLSHLLLVSQDVSLYNQASTTIWGPLHPPSGSESFPVDLS